MEPSRHLNGIASEAPGARLDQAAEGPCTWHQLLHLSRNCSWHSISLCSGWCSKLRPRLYQGITFHALHVVVRTDEGAYRTAECEKCGVSECALELASTVAAKVQEIPSCRLMVQYLHGRSSALRTINPPFWISFKQALDLGGHVKKGEKSTPVIYFKILEKRNEAGNMIVREDGDAARIPFVRWANVFNRDQTEGIQAPAITVSQCDSHPNEKADAIVESAKLCPIHHAGFAPLYSPKDDEIRIPAPATFHSQEDYYHILYHEITHATGHSSRLHREGISQHDEIRL